MVRPEDVIAVALAIVLVIVSMVVNSDASRSVLIHAANGVLMTVQDAPMNVREHAVLRILMVIRYAMVMQKIGNNYWRCYILWQKLVDVA